MTFNIKTGVDSEIFKDTKEKDTDKNDNGNDTTVDNSNETDTETDKTEKLLEGLQFYAMCPDNRLIAINDLISIENNIVVVSIDETIVGAPLGALSKIFTNKFLTSHMPEGDDSENDNTS